MDFHTLPVDEVLKKLKTSNQGLSNKDATRFYKKYGPNKLPAEKKISPWQIAWEQFKSPLIYILAIAGIITLFLQNYTDAIVIWLAVFINALIGYVQERKANNSLEALRSIVKNKAVVRREGIEHEINQEDVTIGDIVLLRAGDKVPADGRIIKSNEFKINESVLTGEWLAVEKKVESMAQETFFADRVNMAYMGTLVESGFGEMVVTTVGQHSEFGRVAQLIKDTEEQATPYQIRLAHFSKILGGVIMAICSFIFIEGMVEGGTFSDIFVTSVAVAVAAIPEGLPMAMTVILAVGMQRILKQDGLVRKLSSAETLGSTSVICTDKTGTLTQGRMEVDNVILINARDIDLSEHELDQTQAAAGRERIYKIISLLTEAFAENPKDKLNDWILRGRPTDKALFLAGYKAGFDKHQLTEQYQELSRIPFNSKDKFSAALYKNKTQDLSLDMMGAPEVVLERCGYIWINGERIILHDAQKQLLFKKIAEMASGGLRVIGVCYADDFKPTSNTLQKDALQGLVFLGLVTLKDPLRAGAKQTITIAKEAGLRPIIITGDHKMTVKAIANELGLNVTEANIMEGNDLDKLSDAQLQKRVRDITVYARVMPEQKLRIINAWQAAGKVVAMTGDGINDAPALKKADVGVALGSGTTVAKEVSDLVLLSDDFSVIIAAVAEGRHIIDNIRKVITYLLASSFTEIIIVAASLLLGWPLPILAVHILWVNLIEDGFPNFALAFEPKEDDIMKIKPIPRNAPLLTGEMKFIIFVIGIFTDLVLLGLFYFLFHYAGYELAHVRSFIFAGLAIDSRLYIYSCKSLRKNIWNINLFSNKLLLLSTLISSSLLIAVFYVPVLQVIFKTVALDFTDWGLLVALALFKLSLIELAKFIFIKNKTAV